MDASWVTCLHLISSDGPELISLTSIQARRVASLSFPRDGTSGRVRRASLGSADRGVGRPAPVGAHQSSKQQGIFSTLQGKAETQENLISRL